MSRTRHTRRRTALPLVALALLAACGKRTNAGGYATDTRDAIRIVGSPLVFPFSAAVAAQFARGHPEFRAPVVESTGTAPGVTLFCAGIGLRFPDVVGTDRRLLAGEMQDCLRHGVTQVAEIEIGRAGPKAGERTSPLFLYVKRQHLALIGGLRPLLAAYAADWGPGGLLAQRGLIPAPAAIRVRAAAAASTLPSIDLTAMPPPSS